MYPGEELIMPVFIPPDKCLFQHFLPPPLHRIEADKLIFSEVKFIKVIVKALVYSPPGVEYKSTDKPAGGVAIHFEYLRQGDILLLQVKAGIIPDPMVHRMGAGEDGAMGGEGQGDLAGSVGEKDPLPC